MWIVEVALRRPYTFIVLALLLPIFGLLVILGTPLQKGMPTDIFPNIRIPIIAVTFQYAGMPPDEMSGRITAQIERYATTIVNDIEHVESQTYPGVSVIKLFFQPGVDINLAMAQVTAFGQQSLKNMPPGVQPPLILKYNAASVPIIQLAMSSNRHTEAQLFDFGNQVIRAQVATIAGASVPYPFGGATRQVQIDLKPDALRAQGLTANDVNAAISNQNLIVPAGTQKIADTEYTVKLNSSPLKLEDINDLPIRTASGAGATTYIRDVAFVHDGHPPQTNIVRVDGRRAVLMSIQKTGSASTLSIVNEIRARLPRVRELLPDGRTVVPTGDQSVFVRGAIKGVVTEAVIAAALTGLMVLLFLGSWRSTLIITISIPLSILASIIILNALGETINLMTLGGLALAVGILVDDATVTIENINRHLEEGGEVEPSILKGSQRDHDSGPGLDTFDLYRVRADVPADRRGALSVRAAGGSGRVRDDHVLHPVANPDSHALQVLAADSRAGEGCGREAQCLAALPARLRGSLRAAARQLSTGVDHDPAPPRRIHDGVPGHGLRLAAADSVSRHATSSRRWIPARSSCTSAALPVCAWRTPRHWSITSRPPCGTPFRRSEIASVVDNVGLPVSSINLTYGNSGTIGSSDADILISLTEDHAPTHDYVRTLREKLPQRFPGTDLQLPAR